MARPALTTDQVSDFRRRAAEVSMRLFVEEGYEAFSLRTLARELGVSHATPYRYFDSKAEIFAAVRAESFRRFGAFLRARLAASSDPMTRLWILARGYFDFALAEPAAFRLAFELGQPEADAQRVVDIAALDAWSVLSGVVRGAVDAGVLVGDVDALAHTLWAGVHGVATLELAGRLRSGRTGKEMLEAMTDALIRAHASAPPTAKKTDRKPDKKRRMR